jgi:hypothetical protein
MQRGAFLTINMKRFYINGAIVFVFSLLVVLSGGCFDYENSVSNNGITGSGKLIFQMRIVDSFTGIQATNIARIFVARDSLESLRIEADENIIDLVITSVKDNILRVGLKDSSYNNVTVNVYASMKSIKLLESRGAADISTTVPIKTDTIICKICGAGTITLAGTAMYEAAEIAGVGSINNFGLAVLRCSASVSGAGNIEVFVSERLDAMINGTGTITYDGNPPVIHQAISGVGCIKKRL